MILFPHISRKFTAPSISSSFIISVRVFRWSILGVVIVLNILLSVQIQNDRTKLLSLLVNPKASSPHLVRAQELWSGRFLTQAKRELFLSMELTTPSIPSTNVLGNTTPRPRDLLISWEQEPKRLLAEYDYWQKQVEEKPALRDGYLALASIGYQLGKITEARSYWEKAKSIDPNNPYVEKLASLFVQ